MRTHGLSLKRNGRPRAYKSWVSMRLRCHLSTREDYPRYGGRGITICERWNDFAKFFEDMGERPVGTSLDRIDNNGNYEPSNCRWATYKEQNNNQRRNVFVEHGGIRRNVTEWALSLGLGKDVVACRIRRGWPPELAVTTPKIREWLHLKERA